MSAGLPSSELASRIADRLRTEGPWDVIGERSRKFEIHLRGTSVEMERGPMTIEGYGLRLIRSHGDGVGVGFQASSDLSESGVGAVVRDAELTARHSVFPARSVELPSGGHPGAEVPVVDPRVWRDPPAALREYVEQLLAPFEGRKEAAPTFGSVKATLSEISLANSVGLKVAYLATLVELEIGVKSSGGPEGRPPGEFWVTRSGRRLEEETLASSVDEWCRYARDARGAAPPPNGDQAVILAPEVMSGILPEVLGARFTGWARLRKIAPEPGSIVAGPQVTIWDEGDYPWGVGSAPYDDEGTPRRRNPLIEKGTVRSLLYTAVHASAFSCRSTGSATRTEPPGAPRFTPLSDLRFAHRPWPTESTLVVVPGDGGTLEELAEAAGEGIYVTQLGWANPSQVSGSFGGEIRIGYRIRGGKLAEAVRGGTVGGLVLAQTGAPSMLVNSERIGRDVELHGRLAAPPILVRPLSVAGSST